MMRPNPEAEAPGAGLRSQMNYNHIGLRPFAISDIPLPEQKEPQPIYGEQMKLSLLIDVR